VPYAVGTEATFNESPGFPRRRAGRVTAAMGGHCARDGVIAAVMMPAGSAAAVTWSRPTTLATITDTSSTALAVAGQPSGPAVVAWTDSNRVSARVRATSGAWSATATLSAAAETARTPAASVRPDGSVVVAWAAQRSADWVIEAALRNTAGTWSAPVVVSGSLTWAGPLQVAVDGAGNVLAAWAQTQSGVLSIASATLSSASSAGTWSTPAILATPGASTIRQVSVAVNPAGAAVIGWIRVSGDLYGDVTTRPAGGAFGAPVTIANGFLRPIQYQIHALRVSIDPAGRAGAAWNTVCTYATAQQANGTWAPATVFQNNTGYASNVALALDTTGATQLLWTVGGSAQSSTLPPGGSWTPAAAVLPGAAPMDLGIAANGSTEFAGWYDTSATAISAAVHTASGWGGRTQVSPALGSLTWIASVGTAPAGGGALITWISGITAQGTVQVSVGS
jgi:hypothetical protein